MSLDIHLNKVSPATDLPGVHPQCEFTGQVQVTVLNAALRAGPKELWILPVQPVYSDAPAEHATQKNMLNIMLWSVDSPTQWISKRRRAAPVRLSFAGVFRVPVALELLLQGDGQPLDKQLDLVRLQLVPPFHEPLQEEHHSCDFSPHISQEFHYVSTAFCGTNEL